MNNIGELQSKTISFIRFPLIVAQRKISGDKLFLLLLHHGTV